MKTRLLWTAILAVGLPALYLGITQPHVSSIPRNIRDPVDDLKPASLPPLEPPTLVMPSMPMVTLPTFTVAPMPVVRTPRLNPLSEPPEVPIQNGATIDFSTGTPQVKSFGKDQDALDLALKEMAEATKSGSPETKK